ncbi:MAG: hypothetical protein ACREQ4_01860 [Candidatus Binataceae bacterium]
MGIEIEAGAEVTLADSMPVGFSIYIEGEKRHDFRPDAGDSEWLKL